MKARAIVKNSSVITVWILMLFLTLFVSTQANAHWRYWHHAYVPVAICNTSGTYIPLPYYVCCQKLHNGHHVWRDTWVATSCKNADVGAIYDMGCKTYSPVYGTGAPIIGDCQFSFSTGKYL